MRKRLCSSALPGAVYVPFIGDGDLAAELYTDRPIYGADLDPARVNTARGRFASADVRVADCNHWPFPDVTEPFAIADLDAYINPYPALVAFWDVAAKTERVVLFGTDGMRQRIARAKVVKSLPDGSETPASAPEYRDQYNFWWARHVLPWLRSALAPYRITQTAMYLRHHMLY